jgi:hypothetical protein
MRLAIGDIHGRAYWKHYLDGDFTEFYVTGDYFDSFDLPFKQQIGNFREICEAARADPRIKLCLGNHDYQYLGQISPQRYSGYQDRYEMSIYEILEQNIDLLKIVYTTPDKYLISHAGVSATFMKRMKKNGVVNIEGINDAFLRDRDILTFTGYNIYGDDVTQSPIWIRPRSLESDPLAGYHQIVGHTERRSITEQKVKKGRTEIKLIYIDTGDIESIYRF